jgi:hypothetical protein
VTRRATAGCRFQDAGDALRVGRHVALGLRSDSLDRGLLFFGEWFSRGIEAWLCGRERLLRSCSFHTSGEWGIRSPTEPRPDHCAIPRTAQRGPTHGFSCRSVKHEMSEGDPASQGRLHSFHTRRMGDSTPNRAACPLLRNGPDCSIGAHLRGPNTVPSSMK